MRTHTALRPLLLLLTGPILLAVSHAGCSKEIGEPVEAVAETSAIQRYEARGVVSRLPSDSEPALYVRHEAVPDFVDMDGEVVGMDSMTMPFPLADGVVLTGIEPGDKVAFTLEVEWDGDLPYRITRIEELPPDTPLDVGG